MCETPSTEEAYCQTFIFFVIGGQQICGVAGNTYPDECVYLPLTTLMLLACDG